MYLSFYCGMKTNSKSSQSGQQTKDLFCRCSSLPRSLPTSLYGHECPTSLSKFNKICRPNTASPPKKRSQTQRPNRTAHPIVKLSSCSAHVYLTVLTIPGEANTYSEFLSESIMTSPSRILLNFTLMYLYHIIPCSAESSLWAVSQPCWCKTVLKAKCLTYLKSRCPLQGLMCFFTIISILFRHDFYYLRTATTWSNQRSKMYEN